MPSGRWLRDRCAKVKIKQLLDIPLGVICKAGLHTSCHLVQKPVRMRMSTCVTFLNTHARDMPVSHTYIIESIRQAMN